MVEIHALALAGVYEIVPARHGDGRGFFSETWNAEAMREAGLDLTFVQDNHSRSDTRGVIRGLHYQLPPMAQDKLVRVTRGSIYDVVIDIRRSSPTFGKWLGIVLSAERWNQLLVPQGFAHGFMTLEPDCEVLYKVTARYSPAHDRAIHHADPAIGIDWPIAPAERQLSAKDAAAPCLADAELGGQP